MVGMISRKKRSFGGEFVLFLFPPLSLRDFMYATVQAVSCYLLLLLTLLTTYLLIGECQGRPMMVEIHCHLKK